jgi:hypothetical protein
MQMLTVKWISKSHLNIATQDTSAFIHDYRRNAGVPAPASRLIKRCAATVNEHCCMFRGLT